MSDEKNTVNEHVGEKENKLTSQLPHTLLWTIFSYFKPTKLAGFASVSKEFLRAAEIDFSVTRQQKLKRLVDGEKHLPATHKGLVQPSSQPRRSPQRRLGWIIYSRILAGRLAYAQVIEDIIALAQTPENEMPSPSLLVNIIKENLLPWQEKALEKGFSLFDVCSDWMSIEHLNVLGQRKGVITHEQLLKYKDLILKYRGLKEHQVTALKWGLRGHTEADIKAPWFTPLALEAHHYFKVAIRDRGEKEILAAILGIPAEGIIAPVIWKNTSTQACLSTAIMGGCTAILAGMRGLACENNMTAKEWSEIIKPIFLTPIPGEDEITPLGRAIRAGQVALLDEIQEAGRYNSQEWRSVIHDPVALGRSADPPIFMAAEFNKVDTLNQIQEAGDYSAEEWRILITTSIEAGAKQGQTPLYIAAEMCHTKVLEQMRTKGDYSPREWYALITTPIKAGEGQGLTLLYVIMQRGRDESFTSASNEALEQMRKGCGLTQKDWDLLLIQERIRHLEVAASASSISGVASRSDFFSSTPSTTSGSMTRTNDFSSSSSSSSARPPL